MPLDKPVFVVFERAQGPETLPACGQYADGRQNQSAVWGRKYPCPRDSTG